ncbi:MAG: hypothetical protein IPN73_20185 [Saprospiraceae bacterium]|nr:hypothetical protein [Saprospiraceae bacterium]
MKAIDFVKSINLLKINFDPSIFLKENTLHNLKVEFPNLSDNEISDEFIKREYLIGCNITNKNNNNNSNSFGNEIEILISEYNLFSIDRILCGISFLDEILVINEELYVFGTLDSYLCYNEAGKVLWIDYDTNEILSNISNAPESFLDCMYELANNNIKRTLTNIELLNNLVNLSGENESNIFYKYLLGIDE